VRILYGVQATGNGHITRARVLAPILRRAGADVTYLFTGRPWDHLFDMEVFGDFEWRQGLTFCTHTGHVEYVKTAFHNNLLRFAQDVRRLDLSPYDLVITDFEPVTAWAAKLRRVNTVGIGHQYAFDFPIPRTGDDFLPRTVMKYFAPASIGLGLHWHHFGQPILPPIIETPPEPERVLGNKILVYLPFEDIRATVSLLQRFTAFQFYVYSSAPLADKPNHTHPHLVESRLSRRSPRLCRRHFQCRFRTGQRGAAIGQEDPRQTPARPVGATLERLGPGTTATRDGHDGFG
jgi:uncharacterized protein (TIGR00661 family)